jgi:hypothetical protein
MSIKEEQKIVRKWWIFILIMFVLTTTVFGGLRIFGVIGERVIFENSFQYFESRKTEIATYEAQLAEINYKLSMGELDTDIRNTLEAQKSSITILLNVARRK